MERRSRIFRAKKQRLPRNQATLKPNPSPYPEPIPVSACFLLSGVTDPGRLCKDLGIAPYRIAEDAVWLAYTDASFSDPNDMLHALLDPLLPITEKLCTLQRELGFSCVLRLSYDGCTPPALLILDGSLCRFLFDTNAIREPSFGIF